jgi:hypothetical protein
VDRCRIAAELIHQGQPKTMLVDIVLRSRHREDLRMSLRRSMSALFVSVLMMAGLLFTGQTPALAAERYAPFLVQVGNSFVEGTAYFYNRNVTFQGTVRTTPANCRAIAASTRAANSSQLDYSALDYGKICATTTSVSQNFAKFTLAADVAGGAAFVRVCLTGGPLLQIPTHYDVLDCGDFYPYG